MASYPNSRLPGFTIQKSQTYTPEHGFILASTSMQATSQNLFSAMGYVSQLLTEKCIPFAIMGGISMLLRGSSRQTYDVDIAVTCNMGQLIQAISGQDRVLRPAGPVSGVMRTYVKTGGEIDPGLPEVYVMVDIIISGGYLGAPENLPASIEMITLNAGDGLKTYPIIDIPSIMRSKLAAFFQRNAQKDYEDISFLIQHSHAKVRDIHGQLDKSHCKRFLDTYSLRAPNSSAINAAKNAFDLLD